MPPTESRSPCSSEVDGDEYTGGKSSHEFFCADCVNVQEWA
jgi:hypothetical protein